MLHQRNGPHDGPGAARRGGGGGGGTRIGFVGKNDDARVRAGARAGIVDLQGATMLPGFIDNHTHLIGGGRHLQGIDLRPCRSKEEFSGTLREYAAAHRGAWITDGDWDHEAWSPVRLPRRDWIDEFTPTPRSSSSGSTATWRWQTRPRSPGRHHGLDT